MRALLAAAVLSGAALCQTVPTGFVDEAIVTGIVMPVGLGFAQDGRFFVVGQWSGEVWCCLTNGSKQMIGTVSGLSNAGSQRGLLGAEGRGQQDEDHQRRQNKKISIFISQNQGGFHHGESFLFFGK